MRGGGDGMTTHVLKKSRPEENAMLMPKMAMYL
jgi:hypothetical protein